VSERRSRNYSLALMPLLLALVLQHHSRVLAQQLSCPARR
jgi:hypothetical protein